ncbi:hypothetical protein [Amycolatopsis sp.]|jgi:hypothetical protein|uniref:hypothetical protein n=1 Tax=Amycolatopsis sp. TaxID=37632 RepID=UPI002E04679F|nr:hypothetical protein [Amycolatopsis sp.]
MIDTVNKTILDVLDRYFEGVWGPWSADILSETELSDLADLVEEFYHSYEVPPLEPHVVRHYSGSATFNAPGAEVSPALADALLSFSPSSLLYADQIIVHCPLDAWMYRRRGSFRAPEMYKTLDGMGIIPVNLADAANEIGFHGASTQENRKSIGHALAILSELDRGIRAEWIILVPHLRYWKSGEEQVWSQVRRDIDDPEFIKIMNTAWSLPPASGDGFRGFAVYGQGGYIGKDSNRSKSEIPSLYFNTIMTIADRSKSRFLAVADSDFALLRNSIRKAQFLDFRLRDALLINSMNDVMAPSLDEQKIDTLFSIRSDEDSFAEWRSSISKVVSGELIPINVEPGEAQGIVVERVEMLISDLRREVSRTSSIKARISPMEYIDFGFAAAVWTISGSPLAAAVSMLPPILKAAVQAARSPAGNPASVLLKLDKSRIVSN